jgi:hypothetical protein
MQNVGRAHAIHFLRIESENIYASGALRFSRGLTAPSRHLRRGGAVNSSVIDKSLMFTTSMAVTGTL